jgi:HlyD family secretion protein
MGSKRSIRSLRLLAVLAGGAGLLWLLLYMGGMWGGHRIQPGKVGKEKSEVQPSQTASASIETVIEFYEAVGTVRPKTETRVESQVMGKVREIRVRPGERVSKGQVLVRLDSREWEARLKQSVQALASSKSRREQMAHARAAAMAEVSRAEAAFARTKAYFDAEAATAHDLEQVEAAYSQGKARLEQAENALQEADAGVNQASEAVEEGRVALGYTTLTAPEAGEVVGRFVEIGDLALPGKPLLILQTRGNLLLEAFVPESLIGTVRVDSLFHVRIDARDRVVRGRVEEVIPSADPLTRSVLVKVALPEDENLYPGMFGRLSIPIGEREGVMIPRAALSRIGQLEVVTAELEGRWSRIFVTTGRVVGEKVEVLSGLMGSERVALEGSVHD